MAAWAGLGYYARARNLIACARAIVADHGGRLPDTEAELRALPGIGDYTAAAIAAIARSEEHTSELQSLMRISYAVFCLKKNKQKQQYRKLTLIRHTQQPYYTDD